MSDRPLPLYLCPLPPTLPDGPFEVFYRGNYDDPIVEHDRRTVRYGPHPEKWTVTYADSATSAASNIGDAKLRELYMWPVYQIDATPTSTYEPLPHDAAWRKNHPVFSGVVKYFPDALYEVSEISRIGNEQHNPGEPLHWAKEKSTDELDALQRHMVDHSKGMRYDPDGGRIAAKIAWRALANLQRELDSESEVKK